ncbi:9054_t:CDS:1 [Funneliformis geosporum]|uniref:10275_t:CDS:1 n=1 Tax=Funneliformis geosporum TaxID=1117311 RepID=A0A9W4WH64_9GLOM|nr:10275_t:CDS:1 [Funneliformis geosporum]CAI2161502.1 9054_t:CDS:1 [Funneliformis geosporum]
MTTIANTDWQGKLKSSKGEFPNDVQVKIINKFKREEIFNHEYTTTDLFRKFYKISDTTHLVPKRQVNSFMILRTVIGLVAAERGIKSALGDGTQQSKIAGFIWGGANPCEKKKFEGLSTQFKHLHKLYFPDYEYKPAPKAQAGCTFVEPIIPSAYSQTPPIVPSIMTYSNSDMSLNDLADQFTIMNNNDFAATVFEGSSFQNESPFVPFYLGGCSFQNGSRMVDDDYQQFPDASAFLEGTSFQNESKMTENDYSKLSYTLNDQSDMNNDYEMLSGVPAQFNIDTDFEFIDYDPISTNAANYQYPIDENYQQFLFF